jgi:hypothetical protein
MSRRFSFICSFCTAAHFGGKALQITARDFCVSDLKPHFRPDHAPACPILRQPGLFRWLLTGEKNGTCLLCSRIAKKRRAHWSRRCC